ncbi:hypothetical protein DFH08DRAFT_940594 [Mycena albidolilacea]|uniref:Uncharacterized protein n=1 Tax=Mycena albidolilacea TaxID=1033008 RepID=A0AAD6ZLG1_9AGAR|nr:hypothetical protein DFH08DRAFT_940594 [Mycena albidolilacea]
MAPFVTPNGNKCPMCRNQLGVKIAKGGEFPGSSFIRCKSPFHPQDIFFHRFDAPAALPAPPTPGTSMRALPPPPSGASSSTPTAKKQCSAIPWCASTRINAACPRVMCRQHCNQAGPCPLQAHEKEHIRRQQVASTSSLPTLPSSASVTRLLGGKFTTSEEWMSGSVRPMEAFDCWHEREQEHGNATAELRRLDSLYSVKSPTPETETVHEWFAREEREDNELDLGIRLSLAHPQPTSQQAGPSRLRLPSSIQQAGRLRSLSASPELPAALFPTLNIFSSPSPPQPFPTPALAANVHKSTAPLRITTQLNKDWMAAKGGPIPQAAATQATFHTARTVSRRPFADPCQTNRFTEVFVDEAPKPPTEICIDTCPRWPDYVFDDPTLARLGIDTTAMELYSMVHGTFIGITKEYIHSVATDSVILLRQPGTQRPDLDHVISTFFPKTKSLHLRYNVSGERAAVRAAYKQQDENPIIIVVDDDSDSEVEVTSGKRLIKREPGASPQQQPCLSINPSLSRSLTPSPLSSLSTLSTSSTPATTPSPSPRTWPGGLYLSDMVPGFAVMQSQKHLSRPERFHLAFGGDFKYVQGTWNENTAYWYTHSTPQQREDTISAGRTAVGLWSEFCRCVNATHGE